MPFTADSGLMEESRTRLAGRDRLFWIVGGAGSGKSTISRALSVRSGVSVYDMDAHVYGSYHRRFTQDRHPVNWQWAQASDGLAWLLGMSWVEFSSFGKAAIPEYLDLLADDLDGTRRDATILIDGGIGNPALVAGAIPTSQIVCLAGPRRSSLEIWSEAGDRAGMKDAIDKLPAPDAAWRRFLEFDERITNMIHDECRQSGIAVCEWQFTESVHDVACRVARILGMGRESA